MKKLTDESRTVKISFKRLVKSTEEWLSSKSRFTPKQLKSALKHPSLSDALDFETIMDNLDNSNVWSWFSFDCLETIIHKKETLASSH